MSLDLIVEEIEPFIPLIKAKMTGRFLIYRVDGGRKLSFYMDLAKIEFDFYQFSKNHPNAEESDILGGGFLRIKYNTGREVKYVHHCGKCNFEYPENDNVIQEGCDCGSHLFTTSAINGKIDNKYNWDDDYDLFFQGYSRNYGGIPGGIAGDIVNQVTEIFRYYESQKKNKKENRSGLSLFLKSLFSSQSEQSIKIKKVNSQNYLFENPNPRNPSCWEDWRKEYSKSI